MPKGKRKRPWNRWIMMCPDFEGARRNRERIANKELNREYWDNLARTLASIPAGAPLPTDIPIGNLPTVGGKSRDYFNCVVEEVINDEEVDE